MVFTLAIAVSACAQAAESVPPLGKETLGSPNYAPTFHLSYIGGASPLNMDMESTDL
jgi:hypothetical protein